VFVAKFNRRQITESVTQSVLAFFVLYLAAFAALAVALGLTGLDVVTATSGAATAIGNVGPGLGDIIGPVGNFAPLPDAAKWLLSLGMLMGRLEFLTVIVMLAPAFWRR
jgi:trk system potassium uptake protein TrkH